MADFRDLGAESLESPIERWLAHDPDPNTAAELRRLVRSDPASAHALFDGRIGFGTAGLRAPMGPGPTQMNRLVVMQTTVGVMRWLRRRHHHPKVVVGYDARHRSEQFARDTADQVVQNGGRVELLPGPLPTPVLAAAVIRRGADAGVMITASHNPAADNGYKLYLGDGIQLVSPADTEIAAEIDTVAASWGEHGHNAEPGGSNSGGEPSGEPVVLGNEPVDDHLQLVSGAVTDADLHAKQQITVVYSAMHGVGGAHMERAWTRAGFAPLIPVEAQHQPDPDFPTVAFPNPEEPGALEMAFALAQQVEADMVVANDPDADRLAVGAVDPDGRWRSLTGDQVGVLMAEYLLGRARATAGSAADLLVASSIVSSRMIDEVARHYGARSVRTLTGFKWVARPLVDQPDAHYVLGYEEALGYSVGGLVRDKDGISAALVMGQIMAVTKAQGQNLFDRLDELYRRFGLYATRSVTVRISGDNLAARRDAIMGHLRQNPPAALAGSTVVEFDDLALGSDLPPTDGVVMVTEDDSRVVVRPSGTEPKIKAYLEVVDQGGGGHGGSTHEAEPMTAAHRRAAGRLDRLASEVGVILNG